MNLNKSLLQRSILLSDEESHTAIEKIVVVIVGGDGSFMNLLKEIEDNGVILNSIIFTQFPFGTANDLSRTFNWGATPSRKMKNDLFFL